MINVKCKDDNPKNKSIYPCIKISRITGEVVLFSDKRVGHVLKSEVLPPMHFSQFWKMDDFEKYTGTIELRNA